MVALLADVAGLCGAAGASWWIVGRAFELPRKRAAVAWLATLGGCGACLAVTFFIVRGRVFDWFTMPTNSMAPTVIGAHYRATCPECGGEAIINVSDDRDRRSVLATDRELGICSVCRRAVEAPTASLTGGKRAGDRFLVATFLDPNRWDVIAYRHTTGDIYLKRVVALPGETVCLSGGKLVVNDVPRELPPDLAKVRFEALPLPKDQRFGDPDAPTRLGADEYFVLGDNAPMSADSRVYGPVRRDAIVGVMTLTYWPPSRIRVFR
jgi:signal peptidase I